MKSFKQYLREIYLFEATEKHFAHIPGFDANNPEHKDMVDAYNKSGFPTSHTSKLKTLDDLKTKVAPKMQEIAQSRKQEADDNAAIARGDAELVHHDPERGVKVYKVRNQRGGCAVGRGTKWCIADRKSEGDMVKHYDPSGDSSHVIHLDKEKGNLSRIGIVGVNYMKPHTSGTGGNFQDKGNVTVSDSDWNHVRKKYNLDSIPALHGVRGIAPNADDEAKLNRAFSDKDERVRLNAARNPNATSKHLDKAIGDTSSLVREAAASHPNATSKHLDKALNDGYWGTRMEAARNPNATSKHLDKALNDENLNVRTAAASNPNATKEHLDRALDDSDHWVRKTVARHPNATKEHLDRALNDSDGGVRQAAASNPNATKEHLDKALNDKDGDVRWAVAENPNATKEHLDKALNDPHHYVRAAAAANSNSTKEHIDKALNDPNEDVRTVARQRLHELNNGN